MAFHNWPICCLVYVGAGPCMDNICIWATKGFFATTGPSVTAQNCGSELDETMLLCGVTFTSAQLFTLKIPFRLNVTMDNLSYHCGFTDVLPFFFCLIKHDV